MQSPFNDRIQELQFWRYAWLCSAPPFFNLDQTSDGWSLHAVDGLLTNKKIILLFYFYLMTKPDMHISNKFYFLFFWKKKKTCNEKISENFCQKNTIVWLNVNLKKCCCRHLEQKKVNYILCIFTADRFLLNKYFFFLF